MFIWQKQFWEILKTQNLKQAYLFYGPEGIGKKEFAYYFANFILCSDSDNSPCGICQSCRLFSFKTHPDFFIIQKINNSEIKIEQIRELNESLIKKTSFGRKVILVENAESFNLNSANALLKNLEEPFLDTVFILVSNILSNVMPTIKSRTIVIKMPKPTHQQSLSFLKSKIDEKENYLNNLLSLGHSPLISLEFYKENFMTYYLEVCINFKNFLKGGESLGNAVVSCQKIPFNVLCRWFLDWLNAILKYQATKNLEFLNFVDVDKMLLFFSKTNSSHAIFQIYDRIFKLKYLFENKANLNQQLCVELILLDFYQLKREKI